VRDDGGNRHRQGQIYFSFTADTGFTGLTGFGDSKRGSPFGKDGKRRAGCAGQSGFTALIFPINAVKCNLAVGGLAAQTPLQRAPAHRAGLMLKA
jgi:hypothetical protein